MSVSEIEIRPVQTIAEYHQAEDVQRHGWNMPDYADSVPLHMLLTVQKNAGLVLGAFDGDRMVGYLLGFMGRTADGRLKHHSHQMATLPEYRSLGLGQQMKWHQRDFVLQQGLDLITWTYDPLETVNGYLNIVKLGAVCRTYYRNVYGDLNDALNKGLPTDRFQVDWWVRSSHVAERKAGTLPAIRTLDDALANGGQVANSVRFQADLPVPEGWNFAEAPYALIEVPARFQGVKAQSLELAQEWKALTRTLFEQYIQQGYTVTNLLRHETDGITRCFYVMEPNISSPLDEA